MIKLVRTEEQHYDMIRIGEQHKGETPSRSLNAWTLLSGDEVVAIIGGFFLVKGVLQVWAFVSENAPKFPLALTKKALELTNVYLNEPDIHRIQFSVNTSFSQGYKWACKLGYSCEGVMKDFGGPGLDSWLFARVRA